MDDRLTQGRRAWAAGLVVNAILAAVKLTAGVVGHSHALVADAVESLGDLFSSAIVWGGMAIAAKPADENHPYGHGKAEPLAVLAVAFLLIAAGVGIAIKAIAEIRTPHEAPAGFTLPVLLAVILIKETMYRYVSAVGRRINSSVVIVDAWHHRSDALTSGAAAVGITLALVGGQGWEAADDWAALAACAMITLNGLRFVRSALDDLMDTAPDTTLSQSIEEAVDEVKGACQVEKVLMRRMGSQLYVDMHLEVAPTLTVSAAHAIAHDVKDRIMAKNAEVADVLIHVEPHEPKSP